MSRSMRSRSFSRRSREISAAALHAERANCAASRVRCPVPCDLRQRLAAARQQRHRFPLELIRKLTASRAHSTPFRSPGSLSKVSTKPGEDHPPPRQCYDLDALMSIRPSASRLRSSAISRDLSRAASECGEPSKWFCSPAPRGSTRRDCQPAAASGFAGRLARE
jgi:hypothetical protein